MYELVKQFRFEAAHTLRREIAAEGSRRVHGHSYRAEVAVAGEPDAGTGMVLDLGVLERRLEGVRDRLDHHLLDEVEGLGPATLENLARFIYEALSGVPGLRRVSVHRDSTLDSCSYAP